MGVGLGGGGGPVGLELEKFYILLFLHACGILDNRRKTKFKKQFGLFLQSRF